MNRRIRIANLALFVVCAAVFSSSLRGTTAWLDRFSESLVWGTPDGFLQLQGEVVLDLEIHSIDKYPPGLIFGDDGVIHHPRLTLVFDAFAGDNLYAFAKIRADNGFDVGYHPPGQARFDEYFLQISAPGGGLHLRAGTFGTVFGNWVGRHDSWENPFINAPIPYERVTAVFDGRVLPGPAAFLLVQNIPDVKERWVPVIWGPVYTAGAGVFVEQRGLDFALTVKNAALSSRPTIWNDISFENPTFTGRIGYAPNEAWGLGLSASTGPYLIPTVARRLPEGASVGDFDQSTVGLDMSWARGHLQIWGEVIASEFEIPNVGDAGTLNYYIESRYKWHPRFFTALRWGQQFFGEIDNGSGGPEKWDRGVSRIDLAATYRLDRHLQVKVQYSFSNQYGELEQGRHYAAAQFTLKF